MPVRKSAYRRPLTPEGIKGMEEGTLDFFDETIWGNINTGTLEQYLNEKARVEGFDRSVFLWKRVVWGLLIGAAFALINQYVGLKVGTIVSGAWYLAYLMGLALKWRPTEVNIVAGAATGAAATCTGFVFSYPAIYLLTYSADYPHLVTPDAIPPIATAVAATILGGFMGVLYFTIFRRVWLVEDPLPVPGIEASVKLVDIANDISSGAVEEAKKAIRLVVTWASITAFFTFLRDFRFGESSILDKIFGGRIYERGQVQVPYAKYTHLGFEFIPIQIAIGWFMRLRTALLVSSGTMLTWFVIIPLVVYTNVPIYIPSKEMFYSTQTLGALSAWSPFSDVSAFIAYKYVARIIAVGAILGGGITALVKMRTVFRSAMADIPLFGGKKELSAGMDYVPGKGWFEWPMMHIPVMMLIVIFGITTAFGLGGFPILPSAIFAILLVAVTFFLGAIGVKTMGEVGTTPVSGTSFIVLLLLMGVFALIGLKQSSLIVMSIFGAAIFGSSLSLSSDIIGDFKLGIYAGTRPYHLVKGELTGIVVGATIAVVGSSAFSYGLATGSVNLAAPQANAFATLVMSLMGGSTVAML
ncbi:MAG: OPT/YSL family transporter, partial [Thermoplasmata archaeon]|nr:OPT/YSL family transporter [Thermoplasmata archaeon]